MVDLGWQTPKWILQNLSLAGLHDLLYPMGHQYDTSRSLKSDFTMGIVLLECSFLALSHHVNRSSFPSREIMWKENERCMPSHQLLQPLQLRHQTCEQRRSRKFSSSLSHQVEQQNNPAESSLNCRTLRNSSLTFGNDAKFILWSHISPETMLNIFSTLQHQPPTASDPLLWSCGNFRSWGKVKKRRDNECRRQIVSTVQLLMV